MIKAVIGAAALLVAVVGGFLCGAINAIAEDTQPDI